MSEVDTGASLGGRYLRRVQDDRDAWKARAEKAEAAKAVLWGHYIQVAAVRDALVADNATLRGREDTYAAFG